MSFDVVQHRIYTNDLEEHAPKIDIAAFSHKHGSKIEAKAVNVHLGHPVPATSR